MRRLVPPSEAAASLRGMVQHHYALVAESTQRKNVAQLETEIAQLVEGSQEGQMLTSIPGIGSQAAATLMAMYERLLARKCRSDERTRRLIGREKVIGRRAGPDDGCDLYVAQTGSGASRASRPGRGATTASAL